MLFRSVSNPNKFFDDEQIEVNYGQDIGAYKECLILASTNINTLSTRTIFPTKMKETLKNVKGDKNITVAQFLKKFAEAHNDVYQKPLYKVLPNENLLNEPLFSNVPARAILIKDRTNSEKKFSSTYILLPSD